MFSIEILVPSSIFDNFNFLCSIYSANVCTFIKLCGLGNGNEKRELALGRDQSAVWGGLWEGDVGLNASASMCKEYWSHANMVS